MGKGRGKREMGKGRGKGQGGVARLALLPLPLISKNKDCIVASSNRSQKLFVPSFAQFDLMEVTNWKLSL